KGDVITSYASANGTAWTSMGSVTLNGLPSTLYAGLALTSASRSQLSTATFDQLQIVGVQSAVAPEVTLSSSASVETGPFVVQAQFTQAVTGLALTDFEVTNATLSALTGSGTAYNFTVTPVAEGAVTLRLPAGAAQNSSAIPSRISNTLVVSHVPPVASTFESMDIGNAGAAGSAQFDATSGVYTLKGSGQDIFFSEDGFHYAALRLVGNGEIRARVTSQSLQNAWGKAGVMFRENLTGGSRNAFTFTTPMTSGNGFGFVWRAAANKAANYAGGPALNTAPHNWVRLVREGDTFTSYVSANGNSWTTLSVVTLEGMPATLYAGLALTSSRMFELGTATFDNVQIVGTVAPADGSPGGSTGPGSTPGSSNAKDRDFDGDDVNDLVEYALNSEDRYDGGWWLTTTAEGRVDAHVDRPLSVTDVSFQLETSTDLVTWQPLALAPVSTPAGQGHQRLTWSGLNLVSGQTSARGLVRLAVSHTSGIRAATAPQCWQQLDFHAGSQTVGVSWVNAPVWAGHAGELLSSTSLALPAAVLAVNVQQTPCYLEVRDGVHAGHRLEVASLAGQVVTLDPQSPLSTLQVLPADLSGAKVVIRPHITLNQVFPKNQLQGGIVS
ncbi:MAG TPA: Ig-like domain-containing protein, partial [Prosthecobacter sp.]